MVYVIQFCWQQVFHCTHSWQQVFHCTHRNGICNTGLLTASCQQTCMTYTIPVCTVKNSWRWTEELFETCKFLFQKQIWEIIASSWFYCKNLSWIYVHLNIKCNIQFSRLNWYFSAQHVFYFSQDFTRETEILPCSSVDLILCYALPNSLLLLPWRSLHLTLTV